MPSGRRWLRQVRLLAEPVDVTPPLRALTDYFRAEVGTNQIKVDGWPVFELLLNAVE